MALALEGASYVLENFNSDRFVSQLQRDGSRMFDEITRFNEEADEIIVRQPVSRSPDAQTQIAQIQQSTTLIRSTLELLRQAANASGLFNPTTLANTFLSCLSAVVMNFRNIYSLQRDGAIPSNERDRAAVIGALRRAGITVLPGS